MKTSKSDYKPIQQAQIVRYSNGTWIPVGKLVGA